MARITPKIFKEELGAGEEKGENARLSSFIGAIAVADLVKSTLGPKGMDKILQSTSPDSFKKVTVTNDGATILRSIPVDNPAAKILVNTSKTQDEEVGDGTTSVAVLAGEFLRQAEELINQKIHPQTIIRGWRKGVDVAYKALEASSKDNSGDHAAFRDDLLNIAHTTLSSKVLNVDLDYFAKIAVDAALRLRGSTDVSSIHILKIAGGSLRDSFLEEGFILDKKIGIGQPRRMENCKILLANTTLDTDKIKIWSARVRVNSLESVAEIEAAERKKLKTKVEKILQHKANVFVNRQLIYDYPEQLFTQAGIMAVEHADFEPLERLALVTGGEIVSTFDHPDDIKLGTCDVVEEMVIGEDRVVRFGGCPNGAACTIVLRGSSTQLLDEAERAMHDALCVLSQTIKTNRIVMGGGCSEMLMAVAVENLAKTIPGKESLAIEAFAKALRAIPAILADNAGFDSSDLVTKLRAAHHSGQINAGLDMNKGTIGDMVALKITESFKCKSQVLVSSHEAAEMIVRVDEIIRTAPRKREDPHGR